MMQTDLSLSLGVVHEPSKVTGCRGELPKKTGLFMTSSERAANVPPLATEDRVCHRFTCQLPGERQRQRERLLSSIALPITCHPSAHVDQYRPVGGFAGETWPQHVFVWAASRVRQVRTWQDSEGDTAEEFCFPGNAARLELKTVSTSAVFTPVHAGSDAQTEFLRHSPPMHQNKYSVLIS